MNAEHDTKVTHLPAGACGALSRAAACTLPAGHPGPHQAHGYGDRLLDEWIEVAS